MQTQKTYQQFHAERQGTTCGFMRHESKGTIHQYATRLFTFLYTNTGSTTSTDTERKPFFTKAVQPACTHHSPANPFTKSRQFPTKAASTHQPKYSVTSLTAPVESRGWKPYVHDLKPCHVFSPTAQPPTTPLSYYFVYLSPSASTLPGGILEAERVSLYGIQPLFKPAEKKSPSQLQKNPLSKGTRLHVSSKEITAVCVCMYAKLQTPTR